MDAPLLDILTTTDHAMGTAAAESEDAGLARGSGEGVLSEDGHVVDLVPGESDVGGEVLEHVGGAVLLDVLDHLAAAGLRLLVDPLGDRLVDDAELGEGGDDLVGELLEAVGLGEVPHEIVAGELGGVVLELAGAGKSGGDLVELGLDLAELVVLELGEVEGDVGLAVGEVDLAVGALLKDDVDEGTLDDKTHGLLNLEVDVEAHGESGGNHAGCESEDKELVHLVKENIYI